MTDKSHTFRIRLEREELARILSLMVPLYLANLMNMGMGVIDTVVAGRAGTQDLAAVALGCSVTAPIMVSVGRHSQHSGADGIASAGGGT